MLKNNNHGLSNSNYDGLNEWTATPTIHRDLLAARELVYNPCGFECNQQPVEETHNAEYGAYLLTVNGKSVRFRVAKITPTKLGLFVTLWERVGQGPIQPYGLADSADLFVISTRDGDNLGQFVFPKAVLVEHDIVSNQGKGGKRAMRVYPPWVQTTSKQAHKTQQWQLNYFLDISAGKPLEGTRAQKLYADLEKVN